MKKYLTVFAVSWQNEFVYRLNFILWRVRNVLRFLMTYFLWRGVYVSSTSVFGYSQSQMFTYVFMVLVVQTIVSSAPSADNIGGEISDGDLSNYLVKPVGYLRYWFTRDLSSKLLNMFFATAEISVLWYFLRPVLVFPGNILSYIGFIISLLSAVAIYYLLSVSSRFSAFWTPENTWGLSFVILVFMEVLAGGIFPLNILPPLAYTLVQLTPFPYLLYFPIAIFAGKITGPEMWIVVAQSVLWLVILVALTDFLWKKGMKVYQASGR